MIKSASSFSILSLTSSTLSTLLNVTSYSNSLNPSSKSVKILFRLLSLQKKVQKKPCIYFDNPLYKITHLVY